ncbi:MAG TPA: DUF4198 domain-containing protein [Burkholderiaceae bacterium]|nr:DUF4198 domain-containing protein [Burkholderiaceae bacterium]
MRKTSILSMRSAVLAGALALACGAALAHHTWLIPSASMVEGKEPWVSLDAAVSENLFEFDTTALQVDALTVIAPDGSAAAADNRVAGRKRTSFEVQLRQIGTYRFSAVNNSHFASYKVGGEAKRWRGKLDALARELPPEAQELQVTHMQNRVDTYVTNDKASAKPFAPLGGGLELIPTTAPTDLSVGDTSTFQLLLDGKPVADADVTVLRGGNRYRYKMGEIALKTDAQGLVSVKWPDAGRYWLGASQGPRGANAGGTAQQPARRTNCSTTVEVLPQ